MKTFKVVKRASLIVAFLMIGTFAFATSTEFTMAKQELSKSVSKVFKDDIHNVNNYLIENQIYRVREKVSVIFKVSENKELELLKVTCPNCDASEYVKHVFSLNKVEVDDVLAGKVYAMNIFVKYRAK